ncbi:MAG: carbohydrate ABC transporter permease [Ruminococcaceae bacterium]|nr:carbohydrate ABC transporter permease [Oscillospiraceae bacterium]
MGRKAFKIFNYIFFGLLALVMVYPFWYAFLSSVMPYEDIMGKLLPIIPTSIDFSAYKQVLEEGILTDAFFVTAASTLIGTVFSMVFTVGGAYVLSKEDLPGGKIISTVIILTMFFSGGIIPMYILLSDLELTNSFWAYIFPYMLNTIYMFILRTSFSEVPKEIKEAAELDGASELRIFVTMYIPLSLPTILVILFFYLVDKWNELYIALYYITDYKLYTLQAALYNLLNSSSGSGEMVSEQVKYAAVILTILPILLVYPLLQKYFTKGVMLGSVKG